MTITAKNPSLVPFGSHIPTEPILDVQNINGLPHGPDPGPWTTPNFQKEVTTVNMKIYQKSGYEKHRLLFFHQYTLITNLCSQGKLHL